MVFKQPAVAPEKYLALGYYLEVKTFFDSGIRHIKSKNTGIVQRDKTHLYVHGCTKIRGILGATVAVLGSTVSIYVVDDAKSNL